MRFNKYMLIRIGLVLILVVFLIPSLFRESVISDQNFQTVSSRVLSDLNKEFYEVQSNQNIKRYLSIDPSDYEHIEFYRSDNALNAQELVLIQYKPGQDISSTQEKLDQRITSQMQIYEGYAPEAYSLVSNAVLNVQGNYILYFVGENPDVLNQTFMSAIKGGKA